jgi:DNA-binding CsgD family transcriptional regulator
VFYGALLAAGTLALEWLDYQRLARVHSGDVYVFLMATGFLALGVFVGTRVIGNRVIGVPQPLLQPLPLAAPQPRTAEDNEPQAQAAALRISRSELTVLREIAAGCSNKEIAAHLHVSPNTIKTHVARLFEKLGARRRTDAVNKARQLGIVP